MNHITVEYINNIAHVHLNRPDIRNAFNPEMIQEITQFFSDINNKKGCRAVVLRGQGKSFCAGGDLGWMKSMKDYTFDENKKDSEQLYEMFNSLRNCVLPIVTVVHGHVFGGALGLVAMSDVVVAEKSTKFCFSEVKLGLAPAVISSFVLEKMSKSRAQSYMITGRVFSAKDAYEAQLVECVGTTTEIEEYVNMNLKSICDSGPQATRITKKLLRDLQTGKDPKETSVTAISEVRVSDEGQAGLGSFFKKIPPPWVSDEK